MANAVREWARANGYQVGIKGRLAPKIIAAYMEATGKEPDRGEPPAHATRCNCGRAWTGLRECHCTVCHRHFSTIRNFDEHRRNQGPKHCLDPLGISNNDGTPRFKIAQGAWGEVIVLASERPDLDAEPEATLL